MSWRASLGDAMRCTVPYVYHAGGWPGGWVARAGRRVRGGYMVPVYRGVGTGLAWPDLTAYLD